MKRPRRDRSVGLLPWEDEVETSPLNLGPHDLHESFMWPALAFHILCGLTAIGLSVADRSADQEAACERLVTVLSVWGLQLSTHYSGMDCPGVALEMLRCRWVKMGFPIPSNAVISVSASEIDPLPRRLLLSFKPSHQIRPAHVFGDVLETLAPSVRREMAKYFPFGKDLSREEAVERVEKVERVIEDYASTSPVPGRAFCWLHHAFCPLKAPPLPLVVDVDEEVIDIEAQGKS